MKITVLNGSPKGDLSVTLQYARFLEKKNPQHEFHYINVAQRIKLLERDPAAFNQVIEQVRASDGVLWAFPLYILVVHAHYKRFIEMIFERGVQDAFAGKYAASLSTSIHYFDHTAHNYIHAICDDLGMRFAGSFSPDMQDLLKPAEQERLLGFGRMFFAAFEQHTTFQRQYPPLVTRDFVYQPGPLLPARSTGAQKVLILHDERDPRSNLARMVERLQRSLQGDIRVVNLHEIDIKASCQGCLQCGPANHCAFEGKDGFIEFFNQQVVPADLIIWAGTLSDRYLSSRWKTYFDRAFFNTHTPALSGKQLGIILSGPFSQNANLREVLQAYSEFQGANLVGFVSDEFGDSADIDRLLDGLLGSMLQSGATHYASPQTFLGLGGMKIFRDDIWGRLRIVFKADHLAYRKLGLYRTFPQRDLQAALLNTFVPPIMSIPRVQKGFLSQIKPQMVAPLKKVVEKA